jgi:nitrate reductase gamma subunit
MKRNWSLYAVLACMVLIFAAGLLVPQRWATVEAQGGPFGAQAMCNSGVATGNFCSFSAAQLGVNALTEPATGTTALSNIVDTRGVRELTLIAACSSGNWTVNVQTYFEDGTTATAFITPLSAIAAGAPTQLNIGSESNPSSNTGTISTTALVRLPQRALAFSFTNAGGAGTCTARIFLAY